VTDLRELRKTNTGEIVLPLESFSVEQMPGEGSGQVFARSQSVVSRVLAGETLIVPVRGKVGDLASIYKFNGTGSLIWQALATPKTLSELIAAVVDEYDVEPRQAEQDVAQFVGEMRGAGLVDVAKDVAEGVAKDMQRDVLAEVPDSVTALGTDGPVGREGLAAADAR
jgi:hypothetical protein